MFPIVFICRAHNYSVQHTGWVGGLSRSLIQDVWPAAWGKWLFEPFINEKEMNNHSFASLVLMERTSPTNPKTRHIKVPMICRLWLAPLQILLMSTQQLEKAHLSTEWWCFPPQPLHHHGPDQRLVKGCQGCRSCWKGDNCWCSHSETEEM